MRNEILIAARQKSGKTQVQVAKEIGIAEVVYQRYEYAAPCVPPLAETYI